MQEEEEKEKEEPDIEEEELSEHDREVNRLILFGVAAAAIILVPFLVVIWIAG